MSNRVVNLSCGVRKVSDLLYPIAHGAAQLARRRNRGREGVALDFAERLVVGEEERFVFLDRTTDASAKLILPELRLYSGQRISRLRDVENIFRIEFVVAQKLEQRSMKRIRSRFGDQVDDSATRPPDFRRVHIAVDFDFL